MAVGECWNWNARMECWNARMPECILATALICWFVVNPVYLQ